MKHLKRLFQFGILIISFAFLALACDNDNELKNDEANLPKIELPVNSKKIDFVNAQHYGKLSEKINSINQKINTNTTQSREVTSDLAIVLNDVLYTEYDSTHTYTFKILREQPLFYIENLVLHYNINTQDYDEYLVQYNITANEFVELSNNGQLHSSDNVIITTLEQGFFDSNTAGRTCERVCETIFVTCEWGVHHEGNIGEWVNCTSYGTDGGPSAYQSCSSSCPIIDAGDSGGGGSGGSGSGGGGTTGSGAVITNPNANEPCENEQGTIGIIGNDGCSTTIDDIARNNLFDSLVNYMTSQQQADWIVLEAEISVINIFNDFLDEGNFSNQSQYNEFASNLIAVLMTDYQTDIDALEFTLEAFRQDKIYNDIDGAFLSTVNEFVNLNTLDTEMHDPITIHFIVKMAIIRATQPDICNGLSEWQCDLKVFWEASKDVVHIVLDGIGLVPVVGEVADLINGGLYLLEGDGVNATLSFAATIPFAGWAATGSKYAIKILDATTIGTKIKLSWKVLENGTIYFGSSGSKLRKVLGITDSALQAHHLIPWGLRNNNVIQKAAKSGSAFHMNEALNGIAVASWRNQPNHNTYNNLIESKLNSYDNLNPNASVDEAYDFVSDLIADVRDWVINNPNSHLNDLVLP